MAALIWTSFSAKLSSGSLPPPRQPKAAVSVSLARCELGSDGSGEKSDLRVGSPVVIVETPPMLKTATTMPSLRINSGLVKRGDVGRILARKPKDVWAIRLAMGTYLIDGCLNDLHTVTPIGFGGANNLEASAAAADYMGSWIAPPSSSIFGMEL